MFDFYLRSYVEDLRWTLGEFDAAVLRRIIDALDRARTDGRQVLLIGNGGSAATASHMACDMGKGTANLKDPAFSRLRVVSLSDNVALMTAIGNDLSFDDVFSEQLKIVMRDGDVVIAISASGNSPNLIRGIEYAKSRGAETIGLLGFGGGKLAHLVDHPLVVSSRNYGISEDIHLVVMHIFTQYLRRLFAGPARQVAFVDRDGVINQRPAPHSYVQSWEQFTFLEGARPLLRGVRDRGYEIVVVTNQQGVGKGLLTAETLTAIHAEMTRALAADGITIAGIFACPHLERDGCFCRKPSPGLIHRALNELPFMVDVPASVLIGDSDSDIAAGKAAGLRTLRIQDPHAAPVAGALPVPQILAALS